MKKVMEVKVMESFEVSHRGILVFLQTESKGLASGTLLESTQTGESWTVKNRIIAFPDLEQPFDHETVLHQHLSFSTLENKILAETKAAERLKNKIYQYELEGRGKPAKEDVLKVYLMEQNDADRRPM